MELLTKFTNNNLTHSFNFKVKMTGQTGDNGTKEHFRATFNQF